ncbi:OmpP1/FadL family transporter [Xanthobacter agilis]|uniref:Long-chain fatty acid transport protein n=1 Tax=Xanthobacter agilis TaxID=47492 RepID=A0ABU0LB18_XANAG|nr:outer membrane protein transport protein [Xanthobacter agilis]MDQ0504331.1 long-chain fatty acid transport protein [Xanthobacter agilis]
MFRSTAIVRRAGSIALPLVATLAAAEAQAGGFGLREQSSYYQGTSFAGAAAGGEGLASMFWNPAAISFSPGLNVESNFTYIMPHASVDVYDARAPLTGASLGTTGVGDIIDDALLPTTFVTYAWDKLAIGLGLTVPFGLISDAPCNWSGRYYGCYSRIFDLNIQGSVAYKVNEWLTLGGGVSVNYIDARLSNATFTGIVPPANNLYAQVDGDDLGVGFNLGVLLTPWAGTTIGVGYKSSIDHDLQGQLGLYFGQTQLAQYVANAGLTLPGQVTASFRSRVAPQWTLLGTVEWTDWSTLDQLVVRTPAGVASILDLQWKDGWFFSGGVEYQWDPKLALRAGLAYELTPVPDETRSPRLPDTNRLWLSAGFTYAVTQQLSMDFAYSHIFGENSPIDQYPSAAGNTYRGVLVGEVSNGYVDIVSLGVRYKFGELNPQPALITK